MRKYAARLLMLSLPTVIEEILSTFFCVRVWGLGLRAVWYCMIADNICKALLFAAPFLLGQVRRKRDSSGKC